MADKKRGAGKQGTGKQDTDNKPPREGNRKAAGSRIGNVERRGRGSRSTSDKKKK